MLSKTDPQCLLECLHDALVKEVRLEGLDLVLDVGLLIDGAKDRGPRPPRARTSQPYELVFQGFHGLIPWGLAGHTLRLLQEKDGAYLLVTGALEEHVVRARGLSLRAAPSAGKDDLLKQEEVTP